MLERRDTDIVNEDRLESGLALIQADIELASRSNAIRGSHDHNFWTCRVASAASLSQPKLQQGLHYAFKDVVKMRTR